MPGPVEDHLNRSMPAAHEAQLGTVIKDLITALNALLAKLDADVGVTGTDYASTLVVKTLESRAT